MIALRSLYRWCRLGGGGAVAGACVAAVLFSGCTTSTPVREVPVAVEPVRRVDEASAADRLRAFRELLASWPLRMVRLYPGEYFGRIDSVALVDRISELGFNRVIVAISSENELDERLREFLAVAGERQLPVYVELRQRDFFVRYRGNALLRRLLHPNLTLEKAVVEVMKFDGELPEKSRIAGVVIAIEPHLFTASNPDRPRDLLFAWSEENFGPGLDNEQMMRGSLDQLENIAVSLFPLKPAVEIPDFYQELVDSGRLAVGATADFVAAAGGQPPFVIVAGSGNRPTELVEGIRREAETIPAGIPLVAGITLAGHTSYERGMLRRRDWADFLRALDFLRKELSGYPSFSGVVIGPLRLVEFLRLER